MVRYRLREANPLGIGNIKSSDAMHQLFELGKAHGLTPEYLYGNESSGVRYSTQARSPTGSSVLARVLDVTMEPFEGKVRVSQFWTDKYSDMEGPKGMLLSLSKGKGWNATYDKIDEILSDPLLPCLSNAQQLSAQTGLNWVVVEDHNSNATPRAALAVHTKDWGNVAAASSDDIDDLISFAQELDGLPTKDEIAEALGGRCKQISNGFISVVRAGETIAYLSAGYAGLGSCKSISTGSRDMSRYALTVKVPHMNTAYTIHSAEDLDKLAQSGFMLD